MADDERIAKLEALTGQLLQRVSELSLEVHKTRTGGFRSMRDARRCPACGSGSLFHVRRMKEVGHKGPIDLGLAHDHSLFWGTTEVFGAMEAFACRSCCVVEMHVIDFKDVKADGVNIIAIEPEANAPNEGPFR